MARRGGARTYGRPEPRITSPGLACRVAEDLRVAIDDWGPPAGYLAEYPREELEEVARRVGVVASKDWTREELIEALLETDAIREYSPPELVFWDGRRGTGDGGAS